MNRALVGIVGSLAMLVSSSALATNFSYTKKASRDLAAGNSKVVGALNNYGSSMVVWSEGTGYEPRTTANSASVLQASVIFLGKYRPVINASASATAIVSRPLGGVSLPSASASYGVTIVGNAVKSNSGTISPITDGTMNKLPTATWSTTKTFYNTGEIPVLDLLVVDLTVKAAVKGSASYTATASSSASECGLAVPAGPQYICATPGIANKTSASNTFTASIYAEATASVSAGVDLWVLGYTGAKAGATVTLDLLKATSNASAIANYSKIPALSQNQVTWNDKAGVSLSSLSGKFDLWVNLTLFGGGIYSDRETIINWGGVAIPIAAPATDSGTQNL